jgi:predicted DNA-binding transcriptional regulator AlpA
MRDAVFAAIEAAVERAIVAQLPTIIEAVKQAAPAAESDIDQFYPIKKAAARLGKSSSTIWRLERQGKMPPRERLGGTVGYCSSTIKTDPG